MKLRNIALAFVVLLLAACQRTKPIVILYENDVHCAIDGYTKMRGLADAIAAADTAYVGLVSSGDFLQEAFLNCTKLTICIFQTAYKNTRRDWR